MNTRSKAGLFLIELIVVITVFSVSAAVCLRIFFMAHQLSVESRNLSHASVEVQSAADCYKSMKGDIHATAEFLDGDCGPDGVLYLYYDEHWERVDVLEAASFSVSVTETAPGKGRILAEDTDGAAIFSVNVRGELNIG